MDKIDRVALCSLINCEAYNARIPKMGMAPKTAIAYGKYNALLTTGPSGNVVYNIYPLTLGN